MARSLLQRIFVDSSVIVSVAYESTTSELEIEFRNGSRYRYFAVPSLVFERFLASSSKGTFMNTCIRNRYPCERAE